jgi:DNA polymerase-4
VEINIGMLSRSVGWIDIKHKLYEATNDGMKIYEGCEILLKDNPAPGTIIQVQVTAMNLKTEFTQLSLFEDQDEILRTKKLNEAVDAINEKYGDFVVTKAALLDKSEMPDVIAWRMRSVGINKKSGGE